jgi:hypothetical protein
MEDKRNVQLKVQEMIDCYMTTDPLKEMSEVPAETDKEDAVYKWIALAAIHGINNNAEKINIEKTPTGEVQVTAKYRETTLPTPGADVAEKVLQAVREMTAIEGEKGKSLLSLGVRDSSVDLKVKVKSKDGKEKVSLKFPE